MKSIQLPGQLSIGDTVTFPEHDGMISRKVYSIFWREKNRRLEGREKQSVLLPALDWCVVLFQDGTWFPGDMVKPLIK